MNNKIVYVLQENANILRNYICYYRYKQSLSKFLKYIFTRDFVSVEVKRMNTIWFRVEDNLLRNSSSTYISKILPFNVICI